MNDREQAREELEQELRGRGMDDHDAHVAVDWITHLKTRDLVLRALGMRYVDLTRDNLNAALARATQAEQERDAARAHVICPVCGEIAHCDRAEVVALRTALETINVGTNDKWVLAIARAALGSTNEPKETQTSKWRQAIGAVPRDEDGPRAEAVIRKIRDATNEPEETGT